MRDIRNLQSNNSRTNILANFYFSKPAATILATQQAIKVLDPRYMKKNRHSISDQRKLQPSKSHQKTKVTQTASRI